VSPLNVFSSASINFLRQDQGQGISGCYAPTSNAGEAHTAIIIV